MCIYFECTNIYEAKFDTPNHLHMVLLHIKKRYLVCQTQYDEVDDRCKDKQTFVFDYGTCV